MKINMWKLLIVALAASTALVGCKDERNNFMVDDSISFVSADVAGVSVYNEKYELAILKNGKGQQSASASVVASEAALAEYNTANGTNYVAMPANCYKFVSTNVSFSDKEIRKYIDITWNAADIIALDKNTTYAIAVHLSADNGKLEVDKNRNIKIIQPKFSSISMETTSAKPIAPKANMEEVVFEGSMVLDFAIPTMDLTVNYAVDNSLVADYNAVNGTNYKVAPDGFAVLTAQQAQIAAGETTAKFTCKLHSEKLFTGKVLGSADDLLIPVRITSTSAEGLGITNGVTYIPISKNGTLKGPWTLLEGKDNCAAEDPNRPGANFNKYTADKLFDGAFGDPGSWLSPFWTPAAIKFPMEFVVDMGKTQVFTKFIIYDYTTHQGQFRDFEFYVADEYNEDSTTWNLIASGKRLGTEKVNPADANTPTEDPHDFLVQKMISGRYLKCVIVKPTWTVAPYDYGRGKLSDIQGTGF